MLNTLRHAVGSRLLRFNQWRDASRYRAILRNGRAVWLQKAKDNDGTRERIIDFLDFKDGRRFLLRDGASAAHTFCEIFLEDQYPKRLLDGAQVIVDVGANIGLFSYYARLHAPKARIMAFEADPNTFLAVQNNLRGLDVECTHAAAGSRSGEVSFFSSPYSGWSSLYGAPEAEQVTVKMVRLSDLLPPTVDVLKVDVEGAEYDILLGDHDLFSKVTIRSLVVETDRFPRDSRFKFDQMLSHLRSRFRNVRESDSASQYPLLICTNS